MGGRLEIEAAPGKGTQVVLVGPPAQADKERNPSDTRPVRSEARQTGASGTGGIRVLLADDHNIIRQGLAGLLRIEADIDIVGEASNGAEAVAMARAQQPDVIIMDISMPEMSGIEATIEIHRDYPNIQVIGLSMHEEGELSSAIREAGACAYVTKGGAPETLVTAIREAMSAKSYLH